MKTSNEIANIAKALCEAQKKINHATKDSKNPHFKNDYASLEAVIDATKASLLEQGIVVVQSVEGSTLETRLQHSSGEYFESTINLLMTKNDMQGLGSSITYARRYQLAAMLNISQADDDGNAASKPKAPVIPASPKTEDLGLTADRLAIIQLCAENIKELFAKGDIVGAYGEKIGVTDGDESIA